MDLPHSIIIGIAGKTQGGKGYTAKLIQAGMAARYREDNIDVKAFCEKSEGLRAKASTIETKHFADKLKEMAMVATGLPRERFYTHAGKDSILPPPFELYSVRSLLTKMAIQLKRITPNFFSKGLFVDYKYTDGTLPLLPNTKALKYGANWVIPDVRWPGEVEAIESMGGIVIRVDRPLVNRHGYYALEDVQKMEPKLYHILMDKSETALDNHNFKHTFKWEDDGEVLVEQVTKFLDGYNYFENGRKEFSNTKPSKT